MSTAPAKSRLWLKLGIALVVLAGAALFAFNYFRATAVVATVHRGPAEDMVTGSVVVHADKDLQEIKSELPGRVLWIDPRQLGKPFKKGEAIVKLDDTDVRRQMKQATDDYNTLVERTKIQKQKDPTLDVAKEALANAKRRHDRGEISDTDWKNAQRAYDQVETNLALADFDLNQRKVEYDNHMADLKRQLDKMTISAPMDGILQSVTVAPGALINGGTTVATFFSNKRVVIAKVDEESIGRVKVGQPALVHLLNLGDEKLEATVTDILPFADENTQRYSVYLEVKADPAKLKPFSTGEAVITVGKHENQPLIPRRALFDDDYVFVVTNGVVHKRQVAVGFRALNYAEITDKLGEGEQVIVEDLDQFRDGEHVRVDVSE